MTDTKPEEVRNRGGRPCKICGHAGRKEIEALILNGATYASIIRRAQVGWPKEPVLSDRNISYHREKHLLTQPISVEETDPETGEKKVGYLVGHLASSIAVNRADLPTEAPSIPEALRTIISAGIRNIMINPATVTPQILVAALEMARKVGLGTGEEDDFKEAWGALGKKKNDIKEKASRARRTRRVTIEETEETVEEDTPNAPDDTYIDMEPEQQAIAELPDPFWSIDSLTRSTSNDTANTPNRTT